MTSTTDPDPRHLLGPLAPVPDEIDVVDLPQHGVIPPELTGTYLRNGPNPLPGRPSAHWFAGDGMLHGIGLDAGRARWYRNRWVQTEKLAGATPFGDRGPRLAVNPANTHVVEHGGVLLALCEGGLPYVVTRDLATVGPHDFGGRLHTAMTAHPKTDPTTGELFFFGYAATAPYLTFHVADATGRLVHSEPVEVAGPTMMHDFAITEHHVVWLDLPVTFQLDRWKATGAAGMPYGWDDGYGARIGVMARTGGPVRWFEVEPCYVFHVGNACEDAAGRIVLDAVRHTAAGFLASWEGGGAGGDPITDAQQDAPSVLHRWVLDPATGAVTETQLDDRPVEFPSLNTTLVGGASRYRYAVTSVGSTARAETTAALIKYDLGRDRHQVHDIGVRGVAGEACFVPAHDARAEDDGWLLSILTPDDGTASTLLIMDATDVARGPVGTVTLPRRVPAGFHGSWVAA